MSTPSSCIRRWILERQRTRGAGPYAARLARFPVCRRLAAPMLAVVPALACVHARAPAEATAAAVRIPVELSSSVVFLPVRIDASEPCWFLLDTGFQNS